ncbi:MAG: (d)CMP kinase [Phycisphaerales bacterium]|nr:(d)CMP kinase [Phycisphaerales bacterium]
MSEPLIITIDGPAGTGKSTVAAALAGRLGLARLDTGAMYRTAALIALREHIDPTNGPAIAEACSKHAIEFDTSVDPPVMRLDGVDVEAQIRSGEVGAVVSEVSAAPEVRSLMVRMQRAVAQACPRLVSEGRDQGSVVFPDADVRFYLTADVKERIQRRVQQLERRGQVADAQAVADEINHRDGIDASRAAAPLVEPEGALRVDSTGMTIDEVVQMMVEMVEAA